jgi:hypothetical protein
MILEGTKWEDTIKLQDPLVGKDLIHQRKFILYIAVESSSDLVPTTVHQLDHLCKSDKISFEVVMKIKRDEEKVMEIFSHFKFQQFGFNQQVENSLTEDLAKIFICGPYQMNEDMSRIFKAHQFPKEKYHFM